MNVACCLLRFRKCFWFCFQIPMPRHTHISPWLTWLRWWMLRDVCSDIYCRGEWNNGMCHMRWISIYSNMLSQYITMGFIISRYKIMYWPKIMSQEHYTCMSKSSQMSNSSWSEQASQEFLGFLGKIWQKTEWIMENVSLPIQPLEKMKSKMRLHWGGSVRWGGHLEEAINTGQTSPGQKAPGKPQVSPLLNWAKKKKNSSIHPGASLYLK